MCYHPTCDSLCKWGGGCRCFFLRLLPCSFTFVFTAPCDTLSTDSQWTGTSFSFFHDMSCNDFINNDQFNDMHYQVFGTRLTHAELCAKTMHYFQQEMSLDPDTGNPT